MTDLRQTARYPDLFIFPKSTMRKNRPPFTLPEIRDFNALRAIWFSVYSASCWKPRGARGAGPSDASQTGKPHNW